MSFASLNRFAHQTIAENVSDGFDYDAPELALIGGLSLENVCALVVTRPIIVVTADIGDVSNDPTEAPKSDTVPVCALTQEAA